MLRIICLFKAKVCDYFNKEFFTGSDELKILFDIISKNCKKLTNVIIQTFDFKQVDRYFLISKTRCYICYSAGVVIQ